MSTLLEKLKGMFFLGTSLSPLEWAICNAVGSKLPENLAELWGKQLNAINKIYRSPDKREVNFFVIRKGRSDFPRTLCFEKRSEFKIAVVDLTASTNSATLRARLWCADGHLFSIEYDTPYKEFEDAALGNWKVTCHVENLPS